MADGGSKKGRPKLSESIKKKRKLARDREYQRRKRQHLESSVNIRSQISRWHDFKSQNGVVDDEQAAQMLLDLYERWSELVAVHSEGQTGTQNHYDKASIIPNAPCSAFPDTQVQDSSLHGSSDSKEVSSRRKRKTGKPVRVHQPDDILEKKGTVSEASK